MGCQKHKELLERWWNDELTEPEREELKAMLNDCEDCRRELEGNIGIWDLMGHMPVPEPSADLQANFNSMLDDYKAAVRREKKPAMAVVLRIFRSHPGLAAAFSGVLLAAGFGLGWLVHRPSQAADSAGGPQQVAVRTAEAPVKSDSGRTGQPGGEQGGVTGPAAVVANPAQGIADTRRQEATFASRRAPDTHREESADTRQQLDALTAQVREMREMMMLALLQNPSASERMRAVSYASDIRHVNTHMTEALLATLNNDPDINVRLTTLDALTHFGNNPAVREGLVESILHQNSPLVQAAMADAMLQLQEKRSIEAFKQLLQDRGLNSTVRTKIEHTISKLI